MTAIRFEMDETDALVIHHAIKDQPDVLAVFEAAWLRANGRPLLREVRCEMCGRPTAGPDVCVACLNRDADADLPIRLPERSRNTRGDQ